MNDRLKRLRSRKEDKFSRICSRVEVLISSHGSVDYVQEIIKELDDALEEIGSVNDKYEEETEETEEQELARKYMKAIEEKHKRVTDQLKRYIEVRANETRSIAATGRPLSVARSHSSAASRASAASREAQIGARLQQMRVQQLERRLEEERKLERQQQEAQRQQQEAQWQQQEAQQEAQRQQQEAQQEAERQQREAERTARLVEARDAAQLAAREAELRKAAENDLTWDRVDDFCGETAVDEDRSAGRSLPVDSDGAGVGQEVVEMCRPAREDSTSQQTRAAHRQTERNSEVGCRAAAECRIPAVNQPTVTSQEAVRVLPSCPSELPAVTVPKRTASQTSWIYEIDNQVRGLESADHVVRGGYRSVPQIQLPIFSGKAIEWPQWIGLFKTLIHDQKSLSNSEKLAHLQSSVTGIAKQAVEGMLFDGELYPAALRTLVERFGREGDIVNANLSAVFSVPPMREIDPPALEKLHAAVHCAVTVLKSMDFDGDLNSTENLRRVVLKLPNELKRDWGRRVIELEPKRANLHDFDRWLSQQVRIVESVPVRPFEVKRPPRRGEPRSFTHRAPSGPVALTTAPRIDSEHESSEAAPEDESQCSCGGRHKLSRCSVFLAKTPAERAKFVGESGRCFMCLKPGHRSRQCTSEDKCGESGCQGRHHRALHGSSRVFPRSEAAGCASSRRTVAVTTPQENETTLLQIVPVRVHGAESYVDTFALLDSGAQVSLCTEELARKLSLKGETRPLSLNNVENSGQRRMALKTSLKLTPLARDSRPGAVTASEVWTVPRLNVPSPQISPASRAQWKHLTGLDISFARPDQVEVLLGANVLEAILQREVRIGQSGQPVAIRSHFGWALCGKISGLIPVEDQHVMHLHRCTSPEDELNELLQNWWKTDSFGTTHSDTKPISQEDRRAVKLMEESTKLVDGHFESALLWKSDNVSMPDNRLGALRRLERAEQSLQRNPEKSEKYQQIIDNYVTAGYARKLEESELSVVSPKRWFLPHHSVSNPHKPGKIRMVFDAAAEFKGTSLNKELLTGPDLLQELPGILIRFREKPVAIAGDIDQMFLQVRIQQQDQPALSFLWRNMERDRPPDTYEMTRAIFGAKCSPAIASYALQKTMMNDRDGAYPWTAEQLSKQFYMDDYIASEDSPESAERLLHTVTSLAASGGFQLRKWTSNSRTVLASVPPADRAHPDADLSSPLRPGRVLGLLWDTETDTVSVQPSEKQKMSTTKRAVLSSIASTFDPLGLVAPFTLQAKLLMQDLWRKQLSWDVTLAEDDLQRWRCWQESAALLSDLRIPRCYQAAADSEVTRRELHVFCDASEAAFGAAGYLRQVTSTGAASCVLVMSRTRVAPLRKLTVVRLELQGAVLATRLAQSIEAALSVPVDETCFWTDSQVILGYISNDSRRFQTFVANRVAEIRDSTTPNQWRHVPGSLNPADDCSRGLPISELAEDSRWIQGPDFLKKPKENWPAAPDVQLPDENDPEVKTVAALGKTSAPGLLIDPARYSSWIRYKRVTAWVIRFTRNLIAKHCTRHRGLLRSGPLTAEELINAETQILLRSQQEAFPDELEALSRGKPLSTASSLVQLTPAIDSAGLIRVGGRLEKSHLPSPSKHPVILPRRHDVTRLIVTSEHRRLFHAGTEHTLNELRRTYWIPKARSAVKSYLLSCAICKRRRAKPQAPLMADLPDARFDSTHAFSSIGLDFFGPVNVRVRRRSERRFVLLLTCMSTRAVHLEVTSSLDTDSFLMALRRFMARRGRPSRIYCDNWKSFKKGERELRESLQKWNELQISDTLTQQNIRWHYNPPGGPHMGGCWERLVASAKRALRVVIGNQLVTDEVLATVLAEVEYILNSRPLTYVSSSAGDPQALTPNHILLGHDSPGLPPGVFSEEDLSTRRRWRHAQQIVEHFWNRWSKEYVPTLLKREKWTADTRQLQVDDVVIVADKNVPRGRWPIARVTKVFPGSDGRVRSVELKTKTSGTYVRPVVKICLLEKAD